MFRYIALIWDRCNHEAASTSLFILRRLMEASPAWRVSCNSAGLLVMYADARPPSSETYLLYDNAGAILGKLFKRAPDDSYSSLQVQLTPDDCSAISRSNGKVLVENYWGRYVAILRCQESGKVSVVRDPSGALPCFVLQYLEIHVCLSCIADWAALELMPWSLNWRYIAAFACYPNLENHATGLSEVSEIQAGECWQIEPGGECHRNLCWSPGDIARADPMEDFDAAVTALRHVTTMCVWSWASCYSRIVHLLSGGLDSSIVLSCLHSAPTRPSVVCLNHFDLSSPAADERSFARLAASAAGCDLIEAEAITSNVRLTGMLRVPLFAKPCLSQYYVRHSAFEGQLARSRGASAIFQGAGGDQVFYQNPIVCAAIDYLYRHHVGPDFFRLSLAVARAGGQSFVSVLRQALRFGWLSPRWTPLAEIGRHLLLVNPEVIAAARTDRYCLHPWLETAEDIPQGKLRHILMMSVSHDFYDPLGAADHPERVRPLVSQPLIELCLRIPTYVLAAGGVDRAAARRAFRQSLPPQIVARQSKGIIDKSLHQLFKRNLPFIRETLLDGLLVKRKLLERHRLESALSGKRASFGAEIGELLCYHLPTEIWARQWTDA